MLLDDAREHRASACRSGGRAATLEARASAGSRGRSAGAARRSRGQRAAPDRLARCVRGSGPPNAGRLPRPPRSRGARKSATSSKSRSAQERAQHLASRPRPSGSTSPCGAERAAGAARRATRGRRAPATAITVHARAPRAAARRRGVAPARRSTTITGSAPGRPHEPARERQAQARVEDHAREAAAPAGAGQQQRVVGQHGPDARRARRRSRRRRRARPRRCAGAVIHFESPPRGGDAAVERHRRLQEHEGSPAARRRRRSAR